MGIKLLNRFFLDNCNKRSIFKTHLKTFSNKTLVVDASIYLYKFAGDNALIENMYLLISIFKKYNIEAIFVFDGKPPPEKKNLLAQRKLEKQDAQRKYIEMKDILEKDQVSDEKRQEILTDLESLKKQFIRIKDADNRKVKDLMDAYGVLYYEAEGEADVLCCHLVKTGRAWGCVSDDMDMFLYGCSRVIRHLSILNHTAVYYNTESILNDLNMNEDVFRDILILSGTDYNINNETNLTETLRWFREYNKFCANKNVPMKFYEWLVKYTKYIKDANQLERIKQLFMLDNHDEQLQNLDLTSQTKLEDKAQLIRILKTEGFLFA